MLGCLQDWLISFQNSSKMKYLIHLGHPAHYHLFKHVVNRLRDSGNSCIYVIKKKDILENLLIESAEEFLNILPRGRKNSLFGIFLGQIKQIWALFKLCVKDRPNVLMGSTPTVSQVGFLLKIPSLSLNEDDAKEVELFAKTTYPFSTVILSPRPCDNGRWNKKTVHYESYHELAYLHPDHFTPSLKALEGIVSQNERFFIIRFSSLDAYHDHGVKGMDLHLTLKLIDLLKPHGRVIISSEKKLPLKLESYRASFNPTKMHDLLYYSSIYIGDSQTMAAEAGVLGTPFIRINDFVGKLGYLKELEEVYKLGFGFRPARAGESLEIIDKWLKQNNLELEWKEKRKKMLSEKLNFSDYLYEFISKEEYRK